MESPRRKLLGDFFCCGWGRDRGVCSTLLIWVELWAWVLVIADLGRNCRPSVHVRAVEPEVRAFSETRPFKVGFPQIRRNKTGRTFFC